MRIQSLIENDRLSIGENFEELILNDIDKVLTDFFVYDGSPKLSIEKIGDRFKVDISILSSRIKTFGVLPKQ